ncbi:hypothetical protein ECoL_00177 [Escherichia coli EC4100B]|nr:hypothetical protein ECoL_00177 [Escherichia coli EC4100B]
MARINKKESLNYAQLAKGWKHNFNSDFLCRKAYTQQETLNNF